MMKDITKEFLNIKDELCAEVVWEQRLNELTGLSFHVRVNDDAISIGQSGVDQSVILSGDIDNLKLEFDCIGDIEPSRNLLKAAAIITEILQAKHGLDGLGDLFEH